MKEERDKLLSDKKNLKSEIKGLDLVSGVEDIKSLQEGNMKRRLINLTSSNNKTFAKFFNLNDIL